MGALYFFGVALGWFPLRHAFSAGTSPMTRRRP
jgi:peptide/nickel transport system permease protein